MFQPYFTLLAMLIALVSIALGFTVAHEHLISRTESYIATTTTPASPMRNDSGQIATSTETSTDEIPTNATTEKFSENKEGGSDRSTPPTQEKTDPYSTPISAPKVSTTPPALPIQKQESIPSEPIDVINTRARDALVNVFCVAEPGTGLPSFTGSGVIVDPRGILITNAHVAEHLLLKDYKIPNAIQCVIRDGSPARNEYFAELMYLPPSWIYANASLITDPSPSGTGEDDFAFLRITQSATDKPLPETFPYLPTDARADRIVAGAEVLVAAYPAGFLSDRNVQNVLYPITAISTIKTLYTFTKETLDLIALNGNPVSQKGSSGGAVVNASGNMIGLIVTSTEADTTGERELGAITFGHISRSLEKNAGITFDGLLAKDPQLFAKTFQTTIAPNLTASLSAEYDARQ